MTASRWSADPGWQHGHSPNDHFYTLYVTFDPPSATDTVISRLKEAPEMLGGGVGATPSENKLLLTSAGQDAVDALEEAAAALTELASAEGATVRFEEQPPVDVSTNEPTVREDGYWVPGATAATYALRRDRLIARIREVADGLGIDAETGQEDGRLVLFLTRRGESKPTASLLLGEMQLSIFEADDATGRLGELLTETLAQD